MKKLLIVLLAVISVFTACNKDEKSGTPDLKNPSYAPKTVVETKSDLESTGVKMVTEMKTLNKEDGIKATINLLDLKPTIGNKKSAVVTSSFGLLSIIKAISENKANVNDVVSALKTTTTSTTSIIAEFEKVAGTYTYSIKGDSFVFKAIPTGSIKYIFPASKASIAANIYNDASLEISRPEVKKGTFDFSGETINELPTLLKFSLVVKGKDVVGYSFTASYTDAGIPTDVKSQLSIGTFVFTATWGYKTSNVSVNFSFVHDATTIFDLGAGVGGNFDKTNIENANHKEVDTIGYYNGKYYTDTTTVIDPQKVLYNANAHFQFMDVKIAGEMDFKSLYTVLDNKNTTDSATVISLNKNVNLVVFYASSNLAIAKGEAYIKSVTKNEVVGYDSKTDKKIYKDVTRKIISFRMIFKDNSKSDLETYFNNGFGDLTTNVNSFINDLNKEYGWNMQPVKTN